MKKEKPPIYLLDYKLKWRGFKALQDKLVRQSGPVPEQGDKTLWRIMKAKQILCWFDPLVKNDMRLGFELPKNRKVSIITNPKQEEQIIIKVKRVYEKNRTFEKTKKSGHKT